MYDLSLQQFRRGSLATARIGFREFLRVFPTHEHAADALFYVGETWAGENTDSAAAVYQQVVKTYPNSSRAPAALYKLGLLAEQRPDKAAARRQAPLHAASRAVLYQPQVRVRAGARALVARGDLPGVGVSGARAVPA